MIEDLKSAKFVLTAEKKQLLKELHELKTASPEREPKEKTESIEKLQVSNEELKKKLAENEKSHSYELGEMKLILEYVESTAQELESKLKSSEASNEDLFEQLLKKQDEIEKLSSDKHLLKQEDDMESQGNAANPLDEDLLLKLQRIESINSELKKTIVAKGEKIEKLTIENQEFAKLKNLMDDKEYDNQCLTKRLEELESHLKEATMAEEMLLFEKNSLENANKVLNQTIVEKDNDILNFKKENTDFVKRAAQLEFDLKDARDSVETLCLNVETHKRSKDELMKNFQEKEECFVTKTKELETQLKDARFREGLLQSNTQDCMELNHELSKKEGRIEKLVSERKELNTQLEESRSNEGELQSKLRDVTESIDKLSRELTEKNTTIDQMASAKHGLEEEISDLENKLVESRAKEEELLLNLHDTKRSSDKLLQELSEKYQASEMEVSENEEVKRRLSDLKALLEESRSNEGLLQSKLRDLKGSYDNLSQDVIQKDSTIEKMTSDKQRLEKQIFDLQKLIKDVRLNEGVLQSKLENIMESSNELSQELFEKKSIMEKMELDNQKLAVLQSKLQEAKGSSKELSQELLGKDAMIEKMALEKKELEKRLSEIEILLKESRSNEGGLRSKLEDLKGSYNNLSHKVAQKEAANEKMTSENQRLKKDLSDLEKEINDSRLAKEVLQSQHENVMESSHKLSQQLSEKELICEKMVIDKQNLEVLQYELENVTGSSKKLSKELLGKDSIIENMALEQEELQRELDGIKILLEEARSNERVLQSKLHDLTGSYNNSSQEASEEGATTEMLTSDRWRLEKELSALDKGIKDASSNKGCLQSKLEYFIESCDELSQEKSEKESIIEKMVLDKQKLEEKLSHTQTQLKDVTSKDEEILKRKLQDSAVSSDNLSDELSKKDATIKNILTEKKQLERQVYFLRASLEESTSNKGIIQRKLQNETVSSNGLRQELSEKDLAIQSLVTEKQELEIQLSDLNMLLEEDKSIKGELQTKLEDLTESYNNLSQDISEKDATIERITSDNERVEKELFDLEKQIEDAKSKEGVLQSKLQDLTGSSQELGEKLSEKEVIIEKMASEMHKLEKQLSDIGNKLKEASFNEGELQKKLQDILDSSSELRHELSERDKRIERVLSEQHSLETQLQEQRSKEAAWQSKLQAFNTSSSELNLELSKKDKTIERVISEKKKLENDLSNLENQLKDTKLSKEGLQFIEKLTSENKALIKNMCELEFQLKNSESVQQGLQCKLTSAEDANDKLSHSLSTKENHIKNWESEKERFTKKIEELELHLRESRSSGKELDLRLKSVIDTNNMLNQQLIQKYETIEKFTAQHQDLVRQLIDLESVTDQARTSEKNVQLEFTAIKACSDEIAKKLIARDQAVERLISQKEEMFQKLYESQCEVKENRRLNQKLQDKNHDLTTTLRKLLDKNDQLKELIVYLQNGRKVQRKDKFAYKPRVGTVKYFDQKITKLEEELKCSPIKNVKVSNDTKIAAEISECDKMESRRELLQELQRRRRDLSVELRYKEERFERLLSEAQRRSEEEIVM